MKWTARWTRDRILFGAGLLGIAYETLVSGGDRPGLLVLFASMLGLPVFLQKDERDDKAGKHERSPDDPQSG